MARLSFRAVALADRWPWWNDGVGKAPVLIELTAKRWKALRLLSAILATAGMVVLVWQLWSDVYRPIVDGNFHQNPAPLTRLRDAFSSLGALFGWLLIATSIVVGLYARVMAWWRHG